MQLILFVYKIRALGETSVILGKKSKNYNSIHYLLSGKNNNKKKVQGNRAFPKQNG